MRRIRVDQIGDYSEEQINKFYNKNKNSYEQIFKTVNVLELNPKILTCEEEYNDNFFNMSLHLRL